MILSEGDVILLMTYLILFFLSLGRLSIKEKSLWLKCGRFLDSDYLMINGNNYYMEEVEFDSYQQAMGAYGKIVKDSMKCGKVIDIKYDLYDWTISFIQFEKFTIVIKHYRPLNRIRLIRSQMPVTILNFEKDNPLEYSRTTLL